MRSGDRKPLRGNIGAGNSSCIKTMLAHFNKGQGLLETIRFNPNVHIGYVELKLAQWRQELVQLNRRLDCLATG